jgi:cation diffusion facilitator CzcD-associated flavoprotein CzcO
MPPEGLEMLRARARRELEQLNFPAANWVPATRAPDGRDALDVLVVGGGMCGQTALFALMREGMRSVRCVDREPRGREGPWATYARMETLRSPKHLTGPDLGVPALTYRAWHEAKHGIAHWESLHKIARLDWAEYLLWVRDTAALPVENESEVRALEIDSATVRATLASGELVHARKVVLALGRDGSGAPRWPRFASFDPSHRDPRVFHSADAIDFGSLEGGRIGVLGAGASAFDNAGEALEAGAASVTMFARRAMLPQVNKSKWASFPGFQHGFAALDDASRWRFFTYIFAEQVPPPWESVLRCERHPGYSLRLGEAWNDISCDEDGVRVTTPHGEHRFDAVIVATGFDVDLMDRPEVASFRDAVTTWRERVPANEAAKFPEEARFPYLGEAFQLQGPRAGLERIHVFNWGSTMSHGALAGDIPGLEIGARRLAQGLARHLFVEDAGRHWQRLLAHDEDELKQTSYWVAPHLRR